MRRRFEFREGTSNKYWEIDIDGKEVTTYWGRLGTAGQSKTKEFTSATQAQAEYENLIAEKTGKGYVEVGSAVESCPPEEIGDAQGNQQHKGDLVSSETSRNDVIDGEQLLSEFTRLLNKHGADLVRSDDRDYAKVNFDGELRSVPLESVRQKILAGEDLKDIVSRTLIDWIKADDSLWQQHMKAGETAYHNNDLDEAKSHWSTALNIALRIGRADVRLANSLKNMGLLASACQDHAEAERLYKRALDTAKGTSGPKRRVVLTALRELGNLYRDQKRFEDAAKAYRELLSENTRMGAADSEGARLSPDEKNMDAAAGLNLLADTYRLQGKSKEAIPLYEQSIELYGRPSYSAEIQWQKPIEPEKPELAIVSSNLALAYSDLREYAKAEQLFIDTLRIGEKSFSSNLTELAAILDRFATLLKLMKRNDDATELESQSKQLRSGTKPATIGLQSKGAAVKGSTHDRARVVPTEALVTWWKGLLGGKSAPGHNVRARSDGQEIVALVSKLNAYKDRFELRSRFGPPSTDKAVEEDESLFGHPFPNDYKFFLKQIGCVWIAGWDIGFEASSTEYELLKENEPNAARCWPVGNCDHQFLLLEMDPPPGEKSGQVIYSMDNPWKRDGIVADSFTGLLERIIDLFDNFDEQQSHETVEDWIDDNFDDFVISKRSGKQKV